ncbi:four-carbon acid sugar kinase family protein [Alkalihalobacillus trypoxylicola]|uniref:Type III effector n=1 Tax=Alkalihalobacillus trypoxylicola TaxID=519424 RepID=A0A161Q1T7_9BACI|nr:four-carbon acid sugar kinase family protein [Alkalihalobacillus trypoxylicola]KYG29473.1 hypothetical protein AZF04_08095 [Alkalihalobacillus trypoxylicola]
MSKRLLAFYGDDFTGSTDAMEALHKFGLKTILFLRVPDEEHLKAFDKYPCIGIAGTARAKRKEGMKKELTPILEFFHKMNPYFVHYKVCSTFDSSPEVGSIGYAADLAREYFRNDYYPLLVAAPRLGRYTAFGHHFAKFGEEVFRLDQHPVMSKHPVTPMDESDLVKHLQKQTEQNVGKVTILDLEKVLEESITATSEDILLFDALEEKHMSKIGDIIWDKKAEDTQFLLGSSGIEYVLGEKMEKEGGYSLHSSNPLKKKNIQSVLGFSGSVSEVTKQQLDQAEKDGFHLEKIPYELFTNDEKALSYLNQMIELLKVKPKLILYTAKGREDAAIEQTRQHLLQAGIEKEDIGIFIGEKLGDWTKYMMDHSEVERLIISGGDTSGFVTSQLEIYGLEVVESVAPGAPLCLAYSQNKRYDGIEIALKSGQLGGLHFFENIFRVG